MERNIIPFKIKVLEKKYLQVHYNQVSCFLAQRKCSCGQAPVFYSALEPVRSPAEFSLNWVFFSRWGPDEDLSSS